MKFTQEQKDNSARNTIRRMSHRPDWEIVNIVRDWCKWPKFGQADLDRLRAITQESAQ